MEIRDESLNQAALAGTEGWAQSRVGLSTPGGRLAPGTGVSLPLAQVSSSAEGHCAAEDQGGGGGLGVGRAGRAGPARPSLEVTRAAGPEAGISAGGKKRGETEGPDPRPRTGAAWQEQPWALAVTIQTLCKVENQQHTRYSLLKKRGKCQNKGGASSQPAGQRAGADPCLGPWDALPLQRENPRSRVGVRSGVLS